jgi:hypothetical protein
VNTVMNLRVLAPRSLLDMTKFFCTEFDDTFILGSRNMVSSVRKETDCKMGLRVIDSRQGWDYFRCTLFRPVCG